MCVSSLSHTRWFTQASLLQNLSITCFYKIGIYTEYCRFPKLFEQKSKTSFYTLIHLKYSTIINIALLSIIFLQPPQMRGQRFNREVRFPFCLVDLYSQERGPINAILTAMAMVVTIQWRLWSQLYRHVHCNTRINENISI